MPVCQYLSVSTKHLTDEDKAYLSRMPQTEAFAVQELDFPADFLVTFDLNAVDEESKRVMKELPAGLWHIVKRAAAEQCSMVMIGESEGVDPGLPVIG